MFELFIQDNAYKFNFGFGFLKEIQKLQVQEFNGAKMEVGLRFAILGLVSGDPVQLWNVLSIASKYAPEGSLRLTPQIFEAYMNECQEDPFDKVLDFLKTQGCTRKLTQKVLEDLEKER